MKKVVGLLIVFLFFSCSEYQKALKSDDVAVKNNAANDLFEKEKYAKALTLYEQIAPALRGKPQAERTFYNAAKAYYFTKQYGLSAYHLENFVNNYPNSDKREEAAFLAAESYYKQSPVYSLDQKDTNMAINKLQRFINLYPSSEYIAQANAYVKELDEKLEKKAFEIAKQYYIIADYRLDYDTAIKALDSFLEQNPGTKYKEEALFLKYKTAYNLAQNSVVTKQFDRYTTAKNYYNSLIKFNNETVYKDVADIMLVTIDNELNKLK